MLLKIIRGDITKMQMDAIVNSANRSLLRGDGVDGQIHRAAGPEMEAECEAIGRMSFGEARITGAYRLPCRYVIHAAGPQWIGGLRNEEEQLTACYTNSLRLAEEYRCRTLAFPLISAGVYGYPKRLALQIAVKTIGDFRTENDMQVYLVLFDDEAYRLTEETYPELLADNLPNRS